MKKLLFTTTALLATASIAAADVTFGGYGRFGLGYREDRSSNDDIDDTIIISRLRINIDASTETDAGVRFSARFRLQADENASTGEANQGGVNGARFTARMGDLRMDVGNVAGALDNMPNFDGNEPGLEDFVGQDSAVDYSFIEYENNSAGDNGVYVVFDNDVFAVAASYDPSADGEDRFDIFGAYTFQNVTVALAYGSIDNATDDEIYVLTLGADFGPLNVSVNVGDEDVGSDDAISHTFYGLSLAYDISAATTLNFAYGDGSGDGDERQYGVGFKHDLGGGASLRGAVAIFDDGEEDQTRADFGVRFDF